MDLHDVVAERARVSPDEAPRRGRAREPQGAHRRHAVAADDHRGLVQHDHIDEVGGEEGGGDGGATLDQHTGDTPSGERRQGPGGVDAAIARNRSRHDDHAGGFEGVGAGLPGAGQYPNRVIARSFDQARIRRQTQARIHDHARR